MSEEQKQEAEEDTAAEATGTTAPAGGGKALAIIALLLALAALGVAASGFYFLYQSRDVDRNQSSAVESLRAELQGLEAELEKQSQALADQRQSARRRLADLQQKQDQLGESLDNLYRRQQRDSIDWAVAEIEHLLVIAEHSLALQGDVEVALAALGAADDRLRNLGQPGLLPVRRALAADINALRGVEDVDISGLSLYLADLAGRVQTLPLQESALPEPDTGDGAPATPQQDAGAPAWKRLLAAVWQELKSLVVISRADKAGQALLMPEETYFLYQNLRLQLESARLAVLLRDTANFHESLDLVLAWLEEYFDTERSAVSNVMQSLREMSRVQLEQELPDISSSLETLNAWIKDRARQEPDTATEPAP